jgi:hypothetical protein
VVQSNLRTTPLDLVCCQLLEHNHSDINHCRNKPDGNEWVNNPFKQIPSRKQ